MAKEPRKGDKQPDPTLDGEKSPDDPVKYVSIQDIPDPAVEDKAGADDVTSWTYDLLRGKYGPEALEGYDDLPINFWASLGVLHFSSMENRLVRFVHTAHNLFDVFDLKHKASGVHTTADGIAKAMGVALHDLHLLIEDCEDKVEAMELMMETSEDDALSRNLSNPISPREQFLKSAFGDKLGTVEILSDEEEKEDDTQNPED